MARSRSTPPPSPAPSPPECGMTGLSTLRSTMRRAHHFATRLLYRLCDSAYQETRFHVRVSSRHAGAAGGSGALFEAHGKFRYCSCMRWRLASADYKRSTKDSRIATLDSLVQQETPVGVLAYRDGEPVGWVSVAPRETYAALERFKALPRIDDQPVWSVVCFFVDRYERGHGLTLGTVACGGRLRRLTGRGDRRGLSRRARRAPLHLHGIGRDVSRSGIPGGRATHRGTPDHALLCRARSWLSRRRALAESIDESPPSMRCRRSRVCARRPSSVSFTCATRSLSMRTKRV